MGSGLGFTKPRKLKECEICGESKSIREFDIIRDRENYGNRVYTKDICIECEHPPLEGQLFCHTCITYKPAKEFRRYLLGRINYRDIVSANNCQECEAKGAKEKEWSDVRPTESDADKIDWYCMFIGDGYNHEYLVLTEKQKKAHYKDICKVFKIRYEEI